MAFLSTLFGLFGCDMPANRPVDVFVWDELRAHEDPAKGIVPAGTCDLDGFLSLMERFPWHEQAREALKLAINSPTLSVTDYKTDRSFFISSAVNENDELGYFIGYIYPADKGTRKRRSVNMYEVDQMEVIREMVELFFRRDERALKRLLEKQAEYLVARDRVGWRKYLIMKQKYM